MDLAEKAKARAQAFLQSKKLLDVLNGEYQADGRAINGDENLVVIYKGIYICPAPSEEPIPYFKVVFHGMYLDQIAENLDPAQVFRFIELLDL